MYNCWYVYSSLTSILTSLLVSYTPSAPPRDAAHEENQVASYVLSPDSVDALAPKK